MVLGSVVASGVGPWEGKSTRCGSKLTRLARCGTQAIWTAFRVALPITLVSTLLLNVKLRQDYIYHYRLPSAIDISKDPRLHGNQTENAYWNDVVTRKRHGLIQNVSQDGQALVFSAYLDDMKGSRKVRAIGAKLRRYAINVTCVIWYSSRKGAVKKTFSRVTVPGNITEHLEIYERSWAQVYYMCDLGDLPANPYAVSILAEEGAMPQNLIRIHYTAEDPAKTYTVCLHNAFNFRSDVSTEIVEWIEVNKLLGADHFMIYNYSSHAKNDAVLKWYESKGTVTIIQWDLPLYVDLIFIGEVAVMTDCLHRNFYKSQFISHLDLDEYIVPRRPGVSTVPELVSVLPPRCGYYVRCTVFSVADGYSDEHFAGKDKADRFKLNTLLTRNRQSKIWNPRDRSKQLVRTSCVEMVGVHWIHAYTSIVSEMAFEPSDALMHHYRRGRPKFVKQGEKVHDDQMLGYSEKLIENVSQVWNNINSFNNISNAMVSDKNTITNNHQRR